LSVQSGRFSALPGTRAGRRQEADSDGDRAGFRIYYRSVQTNLPVRRPITWWWFLVPLLTCGLGAFVMVLVGGVRLRSRRTVIAACGYLYTATG